LSSELNGISLRAKSIESSLKLFLFGIHFPSGRVTTDVNRLAYQYFREGKWRRYLKPIPTGKLGNFADSNVKREYRLAAVARKRNRARLRNQCGPARAVNREGGFKSARKALGHLRKRSPASSRR